MPLNHSLSPGNIAQTVYSTDQDAIRVTLVGSGDITNPNVTRLSDGTGFISSTVVGADRALDVNIVNSIELTVSHLDDSIRLGDGTNYITSTVNGSKRSLDVTVINNGIATSPTVSNVSMPTANTEYSFSTVANTKKILFKTRNSSLLKFCFTSGQSGTNFVTVSPGSSYTLDGIDPSSSLTVYFQSPKNSETLEIITWV